MTLPIDKQYEIIFLSQHPMELQLDENSLEKAVKCVKNTVQYWFSSDRVLTSGIQEFCKNTINAIHFHTQN